MQPELKAAEASLRLHAGHDWEGFEKAHPRPTTQELIEAAQHPQRLSRVVPPSGAAPQSPAAQPGGVSAADVLAGVVRNHMNMARAQGRDLSFTAALAEVAQFSGDSFAG